MLFAKTGTWVFLFGALLHSSVSLPMEKSSTHAELKEEIADIKDEIKDLLEKVNKLSKGKLSEENERDDEDPVDSNICHSQECIATSHGLFERMDLNAKPCEDFNKFACGNFIKEARIPEDKSKLSAFTPASDTGMKIINIDEIAPVYISTI